MYSEIESNKRKTWLLMAGFAVFISLIGYIFSRAYDQPSITFAVGIGCLIYVIIQYFAAAKLAVAVTGAREIVKVDNPRLWRIVENLAITDGLPMPKVYIIDDPAPNAFASGRDPQHALVCATSGILDMMTDTELEGVLAHELGHIKNFDIRVSMIVFGLVSAIGLLSDIFLRMTFWGGGRRRNDNDSQASSIFLLLGVVAAVLAPFVAVLIQLAVSRKREFLADATGALTTRYPEGLASALQKIEQSGSVLRKQSSSTAHLFFASPLSKRSLSRLFDTHPPIDERIRRLQDMGRHQ